MRYNILAMLTREVLDNLPHPFAPDRAQRVTEELLKVVDVPQGNKVLRTKQAHGHYFFWVEKVK
jgi:hypothetical protein